MCKAIAEPGNCAGKMGLALGGWGGYVMASLASPASLPVTLPGGQELPVGEVREGAA